MVHFMGKAEYFEGKGFKGKFKKWWFTSVGVFPVDRSGGNKSLGALEHAREIIEDGHLFGIHIEGTRSPDGRLYKGHTGARATGVGNRLPDYSRGDYRLGQAAARGYGHSEEGQDPGAVWQADYGGEKIRRLQVTHDDLRSLTDAVSEAIRKMSGQEYVPEYAQKVKARLKEEAAKAESQQPQE